MTKARRSRRGECHGSQSAKLAPMRVRPVAELKAICARGVILAAIQGLINAEEYLKMEKLNEH